MLKHNRSSKLTFIVILAAVVAALTTVTVICLRMRLRKKSLASYGDTIDYDLDDCCCGSCAEDIDESVDEAPVQIPLADTQSDPMIAEEEEL